MLPQLTAIDGDKLVAVKAWDLPVRMVHWSLVALVAFQIVSGRLGEKLIDWHLVSGYAILVLVVFRLLWGFARGTSARFGSFPAPPAAALRFASPLYARRAEACAG